MPNDTVVEMECRQCDSVDRLSVPSNSYEVYAGGWENISLVFPAMSKNDRELLIQAARKKRGDFNWYLCPTCWDKIKDGE